MFKHTCVLWVPGLAISGTMLWSLADWQEQTCSKGPWGWRVFVESGSILGTIWFSVGRMVISSSLFPTDLLPSHLSLSVQFSSVAQFSSDQFSHSVVSDSLQPHESQHARPPCPSLSPGVHSDSRPLSPWCHPAISFSDVPFSSCPASESFPMSQLFAWDAQRTGVSASASFLPMNT